MPRRPGWDEDPSGVDDLSDTDRWPVPVGVEPSSEEDDDEDDDRDAALESGLDDDDEEE
ncbi:MAG TPA: hypothetical protein VK145_02325 [Candidatus Nanoarchaeia archaeon]|nr:hypothetical protein [Candidatus Nanoarchaeia archaeon]